MPQSRISRRSADVPSSATLAGTGGSQGMGWIAAILVTVVFFAIACIVFCFFFDQAILTRKNTIYRARRANGKIAITFDDGPSPVWTPRILDQLKKLDMKATFFMLGKHVEMFPDIARRVAEDGHLIGNHGYAHNVLLYYTSEELEEEIHHTEEIIRSVTGQTTGLFRPPKAWLSGREKRKLESMGYSVVLWSINSKDWTGFKHTWIADSFLRNIKAGDIILCHDAGG